jgi:hypothetical protein
MLDHRNRHRDLNIHSFEIVTDLSTARPVLVQGNPPLGVLDRDTPDCLVDAILEHVRGSTIATKHVGHSERRQPYCCS